MGTNSRHNYNLEGVTIYYRGSQGPERLGTLLRVAQPSTELELRHDNLPLMLPGQAVDPFLFPQKSIMK